MDASAASTPHHGTGFEQVNATRVIATTVGLIFAISGMNHGLFEALQGSKPTGGLFIQAIGDAQRFWPLGTEDAFTIVPNFLATGVLAMLVGLAIIIWSIRFLPSRRGRVVFLGLFVLLFLVGGGIGQLAFFIPAWAFATRIGKPLTWWGKVLPPGVRPFLSRSWAVTLALSSIAILIGLEIAVFGYVPGMTDPERIQAVALLFVLASAILNIITFIAGLGHDLLRMQARLARGTAV